MSILHIRIIDAKASKSAKPSHHVQIGIYWITLAILFADFMREESNPRVRFDNEAEVWFPGDFPSGVPDPNGAFPVQALEKQILRHIIQEICPTLAKSLDDIPWQFNETCGGCEYRDACRSKVVREKKLSYIPNLNTFEHGILSHAIQFSRTTFRGSSTDIEDLHFLVSDKDRQEAFEVELPSVQAATRKLLCLRDTKSPVLDAIQKNTVEILNKPNTSLPRNDDIRIFLQILFDPKVGYPYAFGIYCDSEPLRLNKRLTFTKNSADELSILKTLSEVIDILSMLNQLSATRVSFYVFDPKELKVIKSIIIRYATSPTVENEEYDGYIRNCINTFVTEPDSLMTDVQPEIYQTLAFKQLRSKATKGEIIKHLEILGVNPEPKKTIAQLLKDVDEKMKSMDIKKSSRSFPRCRSILSILKESFAIPVPGYYSWENCVKYFCDDEDICSLSESDFYDSFQVGVLETFYAKMGTYMKGLSSILDKIHRRLQAHCEAEGIKEDRFLLSKAHLFKIASISIDAPELRKLVFMEQIELHASYERLLLERYDSNKSVILEYVHSLNSKNVVFKIVFGENNIKSTFDNSLVLSREADGFEYEFDDMKFMDLFVVKTKDDPNLSDKMCIVQLKDIVSAEKLIVLSLTTKGLVLEKGVRYRLWERCV